MVLRMVLVGFVTMLAFAQQKPQKAGAKQSPGAKAPDAFEKTLPAGARETAPGEWRYTDARGKTWTYRRTPFGFVRSDAKEEDTAVEAPADLKAFEQGDEIRFERPTPFGVVRWTRKKAELNDVERAAWEREQKRQTSREHVEQ
ncbi:MAG: hypothetical protein K6T59_06710 [Bryobacteraceae bacterium]|jgi:hypothetical protein|nr:hypothetical protein [Bryobacteraceae bacterium]